MCSRQMVATILRALRFRKPDAFAQIAGHGGQGHHVSQPTVGTAEVLSFCPKYAAIWT